MPEVPLIHIDSKEADIDESTYPAVFNVIGSIENSLSELLKSPALPKAWDITFLQKEKEKLFQKFTPEKESFGPVTIINELRKKLPENGILTVDVGAHLHLTGQQWRTPEPQKLLMTNGWSSMGFAIPAAIAAKLCNPELPVAALMGDGGFLMMAGELATAKRLGLKIVFIVIYDNSLSLIRIKQERRNLQPGYGTELLLLPEKPANHYFGVPVYRAENRQEYLNSLQNAFSASGPVVIEALTDGKEYNNLVLPGFGHVE